MKMNLTPSRLRAILCVSLLLLVAGSIGIFVFGYNQLSKVAEETRQTDTEAKASSDDLQALTTLKTRLDSQEDDVERAAQVVATTKNYTYQDQIVNDLNTYATQSGVTITSIDFSDSSQTSSGSSSKTTTSAPSGTKAVTAKLSFDTGASLDYAAFHRFIYRIEQNIFRMQITNLEMSADHSSGARELRANTLTITAFVR